MNTKSKLILPGGAGLVGQNLIARLDPSKYDVTVIDKHKNNLEKLKSYQPQLTCVHADLSIDGDWKTCFEGADAVVILQAQIGGLNQQEFEDNNVNATKLLIDVIKSNDIQNVVHISSSVVQSAADDFYTRSKTAQEKLILDNELSCPVLRPTLMFGWFDRKHLGWLSRFMKKVPVFPIPGSGRYMRQPLYVGDFCNIIISCLETEIAPGVYDISGLEKIDYIDIIRLIKKVNGSKTPIVRIPYSFFYLLLKIWALFDRNPPFTTQQLKALVTPDEFDVIDWPLIFNVTPQPFEKALDETFNHPRFSNIEMEF